MRKQFRRRLVVLVALASIASASSPLVAPHPVAAEEYWATFTISPTSGYPDGPDHSVKFKATYAYGPTCGFSTYVAWDGFSWGYGMWMLGTNNCTGTTTVVIGSGGSSYGKHQVCAGDRSDSEAGPTIIKCLTFTVKRHAAAATPRPTVRPSPTPRPTPSLAPTVRPTEGPSIEVSFEPTVAPSPVVSVPTVAPAAPEASPTGIDVSAAVALDRDRATVVMLGLALFGFVAVLGAWRLWRRRNGHLA